MIRSNFPSDNPQLAPLLVLIGEKNATDTANPEIRFTLHRTPSFGQLANGDLAVSSKANST
jgi:hypothetical protein